MNSLEKKFYHKSKISVLAGCPILCLSILSYEIDIVSMVAWCKCAGIRRLGLDISSEFTLYGKKMNIWNRRIFLTFLKMHDNMII